MFKLEEDIFKKKKGHRYSNRKMDSIIICFSIWTSINYSAYVELIKIVKF